MLNEKSDKKINYYIKVYNYIYNIELIAIVKYI